MKSAEQLQKAIEFFWETIPTVWGQVREDIRSRATRNYGLTVREFHILRHIRRGSRSAGELAEQQQISRPAVSQALNQLVEKGLVVRGEKLQDRRYNPLELTERGERLLEEIFTQNRAWMKERMAVLEMQELEVLIQAMDILKKHLEKDED